MDPEVRAVHGPQRVAEVARASARRPDPSSCSVTMHPHGPPVVHQLQPVDPVVVEADALRQLLGHLDLGDQVAPRRVPSDELDAGRLADDAAPTVGPDQVRRAERLAVGQVHVDAGRRPGRSRSPPAHGGPAPPAPRPSRAGSARCGSATAPSVYGWRVGKSLRSSIVLPKRTACAICPSARNRSAIPRWSRSSIVREWNPPAREPTSSGVGRRSTIATSTPASASSPASIRPVGPPPTIDHFVHLPPALPPARPRSLGHDRGLAASPLGALYLGSGRERAPCLRRSRSPRDPGLGGLANPLDREDRGRADQRAAAGDGVQHRVAAARRARASPGRGRARGRTAGHRRC